jgi:predicted GIY-YIG superfamily endonuclease
MWLGLALMICAAWLVVAVVVQIVRWQPPRPVPATPLAPITRRRVREDVPHALYDYLYAGRVGERVYVGISNEPPVRDRRHENEPKDQWWYQQSTKKMHIVGWYPNRTAARAAERARVRMLAKAGHDLANTHHNPYGRVRRVA